MNRSNNSSSLKHDKTKFVYLNSVISEPKIRNIEFSSIMNDIRQK